MKTLIFALALFISVIPLQSKMQIDELYNKLLSKYGSLKSVELDFQQENDLTVKGSIKAKKGNKYILQISGRTIYCNGANIWNYSPEDNKVILSNYEDAESNNVSIENFFFTFLDNFEPKKLQTENNSALGSLYLLHLDLKNDSEFSIGVNSVSVWVTQKDLEIRKIEIRTPEDNLSWKISNLKLNKKYGAKDFEFVGDKDTELIDLR